MTTLKEMSDKELVNSICGISFNPFADEETTYITIAQVREEILSKLKEKEKAMEIPDSKFEIGDHVGLIGFGKERQGFVLQKAWIVRRSFSHWVYSLIPTFGDKSIEAEEADYEKIEQKEKL